LYLVYNRPPFWKTVFSAHSLFVMQSEHVKSLQADRLTSTEDRPTVWR